MVRKMYCGLVTILEQVPALGWEIIFVDDGSSDATLSILREIQRADARVRLLALSRNFGHQMALTAGMQNAAGNAVVVMDADLQHPPEVIPEMLDRWRQGADVAYGVRTESEDNSNFKHWTSKIFYQLFNRLSTVSIPSDSADFRLMDRLVVDAFLSMPERDRFVRGMVAWTGFRQEAVPYHQAGRARGETKYSLQKMLQLAFNGILSFSSIPLRLMTRVGFLVAGFALVSIVYVLAVRLFTHDWVAGWAMQSISILFLGGLQLIIIGVLGEYLERIYKEIKQRPLYLVKERLGFDSPGHTERKHSD